MSPRMASLSWGIKKKKLNIKALKVQWVPDSFMDGYVIGMAAHSSSIEGQHLKQQNISLCGCKARIWVSKSEFK